MLNCAAPSTRRCWEKRLSPVCSRRTPSACALRKRRGKSGSGWRPTAPLPNRRSLTCVRRRIRIAPPRSGCRRTGAGSACRRRQPAGVPSAAARRRRPLVLVSAISPLAGGWLQLPGDNPADRRHLPRPGSGGEATPESPFTPLRRGGGRVPALRRQRGPGSGIKLSGRPSAEALPAPASLSAAPLGGRAAGSDIWRMKLEMNADAFRRLGQPCAAVSAR